jgi:Txe/YoeB family toxin of Txe-Axe toxin-antitoxin module
MNKPKTINAISDDLFNFLGEIGALSGEAEEEYIKRINKETNNKDDKEIKE